MGSMRDLPRVGGRRTCVIVCGMHRTGTSAIARTVNLLGADIATDLIQPGVDNVRGYWESNGVVQIHEQLLEDLGSSSADPLPLPDGWINTSFARLARERLVELIQSEFGDSSLFVIKDPRISKLLPLWIELLDAIDVDIAVVLTFRNPLEVAASLERRDHMPLASSLLLYVSSYLKAEMASRGCPRLFVSYAHVVSDWRVLDSRLRLILGSRLPRLDERRSLQISGYLAPDLRHHHHDRADLARRIGIPAIVADLYDLLSEAEAGGNEASLARAFDELSRSADGMAALFRDLVQSERAERKAFENSTSWRVTAPLRWLKHELQRK
jgi:hypothetical protein